MIQPKLHPVDQAYYDWLVNQIEVPRNFNQTFNDLLSILHNAEFIWIISGDDNRSHDGMDLRIEFINIIDETFLRNNFKEYVSILEIVIALSRRLEFVAGGEAKAWAWQLLENLQLNNFYDPLDEQKIAVVCEILDRLIWRTYHEDGSGGFFPLNNPKQDQTKHEIWHQMNAYVNEIQEP